ncbi:MAG TPA: sialidase family protein [Pirellulales bacterium]|jgi:hypothetical protein|nr:sialidase family protein [Pirellulales bacterium]
MRLALRICLAAAVAMFSLATARSVRAFNSVRVVAEGALPEAKEPQVAIDARGTIYVAYGSRNEIYVSVSHDQGQTFGAPHKVGANGVLALGMRRGPRIGVSAKGLMVTAVTGAEGKGKDGDLFAWRSSDEGETWKGPARVDDVAGAAREGLHGLAVGPHGEAYCVWLDLRIKGSRLFGSASTDGGENWSKNVLVYESPSGGVCPCCHPSVAYDPQGHLAVLFRNVIDGNRDLYLCESADGKKFEPARKLGVSSWHLDVCPMDGGCLAYVPATKSWASIWRRENSIFRTLDRTVNGAPEPESPVGAGEQPWLAVSHQGLEEVWLTKRHGELNLLRAHGRLKEKLADVANDPVIASSPSGLGPVVVCWETSAGDAATIRCAVIEPGK